MAGGGGGGSTTDEYMRRQHFRYFSSAASDGTGGNFIVADILSLFNAAYVSNPFSGKTGYNPATSLASLISEISAFDTSVGTMSASTDVGSLFTYSVADIDNDISTMTWADPTLNAPADISFGSLTFNADTDISGGWTDPAPAASGEITASVAAFKAIHDDIVDNDTVPKFKIGVRDIGAVQTSVFTLGQSFLEAMGDRDVAKYQGDLRSGAYLQRDNILAESIKSENLRIADAHIQEDSLNAQNSIAESTKVADAHIQVDALTTDYTNTQNKLDMAVETLRMDAIMRQTDMMLRYTIAKKEHEKNAAFLYTEYYSRSIVANVDYINRNLAIDESYYKWGLDLSTYVNNAFAAISGGTTQPKGLTKEQSALAYGAQGAAIGTAIQPGAGTAWGGAIGMAVGYYMGE